MLVQFPESKNHSCDSVPNTLNRLRCYEGKMRSFEMLMSHCLWWMEDLQMQIECLLKAESLFLTHSLFQVMRETHTQVKWPSKLKIGAKSKKGEWCLSSFTDPHVRFKHTTKRHLASELLFKTKKAHMHHKSIITVHSKL